MQIFAFIYLTLAALASGGLIPWGYDCIWDYKGLDCTPKPKPTTYTITKTIGTKPTTITTVVKATTTYITVPYCSSYETYSLSFRGSITYYPLCFDAGCYIIGYSTTTTATVDGTVTTITKEDYPVTIPYTRSYCAASTILTTVWPRPT